MRLPDAELEIMQEIWKTGGEVTTADIMQNLTGKKAWAVTTVLSFLARLVERGFLTVRRKGKINLYSSVISENEYLENASKTFLEKLHGNSLKSLVASLYAGNAISGNDIDELRRFIDEAVYTGDDS
ncbi:MAG: BlaI/MecI/CopY family transcriptional regulator [Defluviitaleaceae bacterium]|nr:BlaI/MecI/CopY family transcriptional regulator [Defluviitaleaceae bacterium]